MKSINNRHGNKYFLYTQVFFFIFLSSKCIWVKWASNMANAKKITGYYNYGLGKLLPKLRLWKSIICRKFRTLIHFWTEIWNFERSEMIVIVIHQWSIKPWSSRISVNLTTSLLSFFEIIIITLNHRLYFRLQVMTSSVSFHHKSIY